MGRPRWPPPRAVARKICCSRHFDTAPACFLGDAFSYGLEGSQTFADHAAAHIDPFVVFAGGLVLWHLL